MKLSVFIFTEHRSE